MRRGIASFFINTLSLTGSEPLHVLWINSVSGFIIWIPKYLGEAPAVIAHLKRHRLAREAKVLAAMRAHPNGNDDDWVAHAYADTPQALWPVAKRPMQAHIERIKALNLLA